MKNNTIFKILPFVSEKIWGYERWIVSTLKNGQSLAEPDKMPLAQKLDGDYPLLLKVIQANETLSVQVHPEDEYAAKHENSYGKTECWYILEADPQAALICGLKDNYERKLLASAIETNTLEDCLYSVSVNAGDFIFIPAGTVHAIKGGLRILEIQQPSDVTYRLYDWDRGRELHVEKSLDVIERAFKTKLPPFSLPSQAFVGTFSCPYFTVQKHELYSNNKIQTGKERSCFFVIAGSGSAASDGIKLALQKEDVFMADPDTVIQFSGNLSIMQIIPV